MAPDAGTDEREAPKLTDTIYALSSGSPPAGIAVIRISGPSAHSVLESLAGRLPEPRIASVAELRDGADLLDQALVLRFSGPRSATGEDVAELHLHGGRAVVARVMDSLSRRPGLRQAQAGEFTRRAFDNGRIDLAETEGLADLLEAETESQRRNALLLAGGSLSRKVESWQERILSLAATIEAILDFSDEDDVDPLPSSFKEDIESLRQEIGDWLARPPAQRLKDGVKVVIAGPPNAGKSSLFNALIGRDAAITAASPGTTRDMIEAPVAIHGRPFLIVDTAGLRTSQDEIEAIGVERGQAAAQTADLLLWLGEPSEAPKGAIRIHSKSDLGPAAGQIDLGVSVRTGEGLDRLTQMLATRASALLPQEGEVALHSRHRSLLGQIHVALSDAEHDDILIIAESLRSARSLLDQITGRSGVENMLDVLFGRFCIGK